MDFAVNFTANLLSTNHLNETGVFQPKACAKHLANEPDKSFNQYGDKLYGCKEGDFDDEPTVCSPCTTNGEEEDENTREKKRFPNCDKCHQSCKAPNALMLQKLNVQIEWLKTNKDRVPNSILRDRGLISSDVQDYCQLDILFFFPGRVAKQLFPGQQLTCWNGTNCKVPPNSKRKNKVGVTSEIQEQKIKYRFVEGIDGNGFVLFPEYYCTRCEFAKSATEISMLPLMNIPVVIMRQAPVVFTHVSALTKELFELIMTQMMSPSGAEQISKYLSKMHAARYLEEGRVYLEMVLLRRVRTGSMHDYCSSGSSSSSISSHTIPWPAPDSHCGGLGRVSTGLSKQHISEIFIASTAHMAKLADALQGSIGGEVLKSDGNYSIPKRIFVSAGSKITCLQGCKSSYNILLYLCFFVF